MKTLNNLNLHQCGIAILLCLIMGCGSDSTSKPNLLRANNEPILKPVEIKSGMEQGHPAGITLGIQQSRETDSTNGYELMSIYGDKKIGLLLIIPREGVAKPAHMAWLKSLGPPSDVFLHLLAIQYHQQLDSNAKFADSIPFICFNLRHFYFNEADSARNIWIAADYKLFFDSESEEGDAELFMNINIAGQSVEFAEKDEDYRSHLIHLLSRP